MGGAEHGINRASFASAGPEEKGGKTMRIIVDGFGGDNAPLSVIEGCALAVKELGTDIILTGDEKKIAATAEEHGISLAGIQIVHAPDVIPMEEEPTQLLKTYQNSSMAVGFRLLADGAGSAIVTAGSTGAAVVGANLIVKRIRGIKRCAIGTVIPCPETGGSYMLIDSGANSECRPDMLRQFGLMGSVYMERIEGVQAPRVGLVNIGTEESKGRDLQRETFTLLQGSELNFIGNVEAREVPLGGCDVAVCDGFTGNVMLKLIEGMAKMFSHQLKGMLLHSFGTKIAALLLKDQISAFKKIFDSNERGGALMLGARRPVIKVHGNANALAVKNGIAQAMSCCENGVVEEITRALTEIADAGQKPEQDTAD